MRTLPLFYLITLMGHGEYPKTLARHPLFGWLQNKNCSFGWSKVINFEQTGIFRVCLFYG
jgi:hypothetical protein